ncbi:MAG TPA: DUF1634 domain-containing protein [Candidatus Binataceae bacterium]|nr:DUF1634 domain-containing protein [Candidatus Binataceae bacterium]
MPVDPEEERILRLWTPVLLRVILVAAVVLMALGTGLTLFVARDHVDPATFRHPVSVRVPLLTVLSEGIRGNANAIATLGLMVLTLVPLVRVALCFLLFLKERSGIFAAFTAYVLAGLIAGILLGRIG